MKHEFLYSSKNKVEMNILNGLEDIEIYNEAYILTGQIYYNIDVAKKSIINIWNKNDSNKIHTNKISDKLNIERTKLPIKLTLLEYLKYSKIRVRKHIVDFVSINNLNLEILPTKISYIRGYLLQCIVKSNILNGPDQDAILDPRFLKFVETLKIRHLELIGTPLISNNIIINAISGVLSNLDPNTFKNKEYPEATGNPIDVLYTNQNDLQASRREIELGIQTHNILNIHAEYMWSPLYQLFRTIRGVKNLYNINNSNIGIDTETTAIILGRYLIDSDMVDMIFNKISIQSFNLPQYQEGNIFSMIPIRETYRMAWRLKIENKNFKLIHILLQESEEANLIAENIKTGTLNLNNFEEIFIYLTYLEVDTDGLSVITLEEYKNIMNIYGKIPDIKSKLINNFERGSHLPPPENLICRCCNLPEAFNEAKNGKFCQLDLSNQNSEEKYILSNVEDPSKLFKMLATYKPIINYELFKELLLLPYNAIKLLLLCKKLTCFQVSMLNHNEAIVTLSCGVAAHINNYEKAYKLTVISNKDNPIIQNMIFPKLGDEKVQDNLELKLRRTLEPHKEIIRKYVKYPNFSKFFDINLDNLKGCLREMGISSNSKYTLSPQLYQINDISNNGPDNLLSYIISNIIIYLYIDVNLKLNSLEQLGNNFNERVNNLKYYTDFELLRFFEIEDVYTRKQLLHIIYNFLSGKYIFYVRAESHDLYNESFYQSNNSKHSGSLYLSKVTYGTLKASYLENSKNCPPIFDYTDIELSRFFNQPICDNNLDNEYKMLALLIVDPHKIYDVTKVAIENTNYHLQNYNDHNNNHTGIMRNMMVSLGTNIFSELTFDN